MLPILLLLACCCCSSSASGAGAYFLGYIPGNDKYYIRIFQLEKMFKIIEDIKTEMVYEGTAPTQYTGKISGTDLCDELIKFKENLDEKRDDEIEKVSDTDFKKLVETYMDDNEIKGYTYEQAIDIIDFMYASCGTGDKRVFKQTADFKTKLTKLFKDTPVDYANFAPSTENEAARKIFCDDVKDTDDVVTSKGFTSLRKEIADITAVEFVNKMWDGDTGTLVPSGYSLTELTGSVDYCAKNFTPVEPTPVACVDLLKDACELTTNTCTWTPPVGDILGVCGNTLAAADASSPADTAAPVPSTGGQ
jgi:hypothetical protein